MKDRRRTVPRLRFKGFEDEWEEKLLNEITNNFSHRNSNLLNVKVYSVTNKSGFVLQTDHFTKQVAGVDLKSYKVIRNKEYAYNPARINVGSIAQFNGEVCIVSSLYVCFRINKNCIDSFFNYLLQLDHTKYKFNAYGEGTVRIYLWYPQFSSIKANFPTLPEQQKIADFLGAVDNWIKNLEQQKEKLEAYKKGMMQKIFSQEIRFKDENGKEFPDWEEKTWKDIFDWVRTNSLSREYLTFDKGVIQNIHYGDIHTKYKANFRQSHEHAPFINSKVDIKISDEEYCRTGDVVIADASEDYADIGKSVEIIEVKEKTLIAGLHTIIARPKANFVATGFTGYLLRSSYMRRKIMIIAQGISVLGISKGNLEKLTFYLPSPNEQQKIAEYLTSIDALIDDKKAEIGNAELWKKALLQQLFV